MHIDIKQFYFILNKGLPVKDLGTQNSFHPHSDLRKYEAETVQRVIQIQETHSLQYPE